MVSTSEAVVSGVDEAVGMHGYPCWTLCCSPNTFAVISSGMLKCQAVKLFFTVSGGVVVCVCQTWFQVFGAGLLLEFSV